MPKIVDHEERRRAIAQQVLSSAAAEGLEGVSMRAVAARLSISLGAIQHYFASREAMLAYAVAELGRRREARVKGELTSLGRVATERDILRASALAGIPLDAERREECLAEAAFLSMMIGGDRQGARAVKELLGFFESVLCGARDRGMLAPDVDPRREARILWAIVSSQAQGVLMGAADAGEVVRTIDYWLARVFQDSEQ